MSIIMIIIKFVYFLVWETGKKSKIENIVNVLSIPNLGKVILISHNKSH